MAADFTIPIVDHAEAVVLAEQLKAAFLNALYLVKSKNKPTVITELLLFIHGGNLLGHRAHQQGKSKSLPVRSAPAPPTNSTHVSSHTCADCAQVGSCLYCDPNQRPGTLYKHCICELNKCKYGAKHLILRKTLLPQKSNNETLCIAGIYPNGLAAFEMLIIRILVIWQPLDRGNT